MGASITAFHDPFNLILDKYNLVQHSNTTYRPQRYSFDKVKYCKIRMICSLTSNPLTKPIVNSYAIQGAQV